MTMARTPVVLIPPIPAIRLIIQHQQAHRTDLEHDGRESAHLAVEGGRAGAGGYHAEGQAVPGGELLFEQVGIEHGVVGVELGEVEAGELLDGAAGG